MSEQIYLMDNESLQEAIINTNAMLKACPSQEPWRYEKLKAHFQELLTNQMSRARLAVYQIDRDANAI